MNKPKSKRGLFNIILFAVTFFILSYFIGNWKSLVLTILLFIFAKIVQVKKRGYFWKDKLGNKLSFKQFLKSWKRGVQGITPLQQSKMNLMGIWITLTGIIAGIVINALVRMKSQWIWIEIVLVGSLILASVQFLGIYQKYLKHKEVDKMMKELNKSGGKNDGNKK